MHWATFTLRQRAGVIGMAMVVLTILLAMAGIFGPNVGPLRDTESVLGPNWFCTNGPCPFCVRRVK
jgi:hypothetical protein